MNLSGIAGASTSRPGGAKENAESVSYGTKDGKIRFGHLHMESTNLDSVVTSGVYLQAYDSRHYMTMDIDGHRKGWTINRCPGTYEILCSTDNKQKDIGFFLLAENGDVVIRAPNGRVRISGLDVDIRAIGSDNTKGTINLDSNNSVNVKTGSFDVNATVGIKLFTPYTMDIISNVALNLTSNFTNCLTSTSRIYPNKSAIPTQSTLKFILNSAYSILG
jgi:hypothetical protein